MPPDTSDAAAQKRVVLAFRLQTVLVVVALMAFSGGVLLFNTPSFKAAAVYLLSNVLLTVIPPRCFKSPLLTGGMLLADVVLVSVCIYFVRDAGSDLYLLYFLAILMAALSRDLRATVAAAAVVSAVYIWVSFRSLGISHVLSSSFLLRIPLFFVTSFFAGYLAKQTRLREIEHKRAMKATTVLEQRLEITRQHEETLLDKYRRLYEHHQNIMSSISSGILVTDEERVVSIFNREAERITKLSAPEVVGRVASRFPALEPFSLAIGRTKDTGITSSSQEVTLAADGRSVPVGFSTSLLRNQDDGVTGVIVAFRDLTEIKELRDQIQRSERLALLGEMAASVAHEIRNPLNSISGFAQLLCERAGTDVRHRQFAGIIVDEAARIDTIIRQTLCFAKDNDVPFEAVDLNEIVSSMAAAMQDKLVDRSLRITLDLNPYLPLVEGNSLQLHQVCSNIVNNAIQALDESGEIKITTREETGVVVARFEDNGPGVPAELREKIFNPFFTTKTEGTGLGLALSQKILTDHGGDIRLGGAPVRGAVFEIRLPVYAKADTPELSLKPTGTERGF